MSFPHTYIIIEWLTCALTPTSSISAIFITRTNSLIYRTTVESHYAKIDWVKFSDESKWFPGSVSNYVKVNCFYFFFLKFEPRGKVYSIQHYVITFASHLRQDGGFLRLLRFPPPIQLTANDITEIWLKVVLNTINQTKPNSTP